MESMVQVVLKYALWNPETRLTRPVERACGLLRNSFEGAEKDSVAQDLASNAKEYALEQLRATARY